MTRIHTHFGDRFMIEAKDLLLGVLASEINKPIGLVYAEDKIISNCICVLIVLTSICLIDRSLWIEAQYGRLTLQMQ